MFNNDEKRKLIPVQLGLSDGRRLEGNLVLPLSVDLRRALNGDNPLLEFNTLAGVVSFIVKSAITEITPGETTPALP